MLLGSNNPIDLYGKIIIIRQTNKMPPLIYCGQNNVFSLCYIFKLFQIFDCCIIV